MKGTSNRIGMATLNELMSGQITTSQLGFQISKILTWSFFGHQVYYQVFEAIWSKPVEANFILSYTQVYE